MCTAVAIVSNTVAARPEGAVEEFKDRWERGMNNLCEDVGEMAGRIGKIAMNYFELIETGKTEMAKAKSAAADLNITGGGK